MMRITINKRDGSDPREVSEASMPTAQSFDHLHDFALRLGVMCALGYLTLGGLLIWHLASHAMETVQP